ncbi:MAG: hypothetical protein WA840_15380 [Caulobacteraceae bacterium]
MAAAGKRGALKDFVAEGEVGEQRLRIVGFTAGNRSAAYHPDRVTIETADGQVIQARDHPGGALPASVEEGSWDDLDLAFFCGLTIRNHMAIPSCFADPGFQVDEVAPRRDDAQGWRRLRVRFPPEVATYAREQIFSFDENGLQRRMECDFRRFGAESLVLSWWAHQVFAGVTAPTLGRMVLARRVNGIVSQIPLIDLEMFDLSFE